jgi:molecular chaperone DnaK
VSSTETIDVGIDLGTTNSAIALLRDGQPEVLRNNEQQELTPSAVIVDRNGAVSVGQRAHRQAEVRPGAVAREFKRAMGSDQVFAPGGRVMTPEALSAEVLKSLRADAEARTGFAIRAAVITIPAMFTQAGSHATMRAARLAGIEQAPLLQEPIAAGLAYGVQEDAGSGYWAVYDLGGGTFDVSLMRLQHGRLLVVDHAGDDFLGGRTFDNAVIDFVVGELRGEHPLPATVRAGDDRYARLKLICEEARIRLSREPSVVIDVAGISDDGGREIDTYVELTRSRFERLIEVDVRRSVALLLDLIARAGLDRSAVQRVIAVGGPTLTPFVRELIEAWTAIPVDTRIDPMTVVARGAALFSGTVFREVRSGPAAPPDAVDVALTFEPVVEDAEVLVGGAVAALAGHGGATAEVRRADGAWSSGRLPLAEGRFVVTAPLAGRGANAFELRAFRSDGTAVPLSPSSFTARRGVTAERPPLSRSLSVAVEDAGEHPRARRVIERGARLPAISRLTLRTTRPLAPGQPAAITVYVVEGEADRADRNDHVGHVRIDGSSIRRVLPVGSEVELRLRVDESRQLDIAAYIPLLDESFPLVIPDVNRPVPDAAFLEAQLQVERHRVAELADAEARAAAWRLVGEAERSVAEAPLDHDAALRAQRRLRELQTAVDEASNGSELVRLQAEWRELTPLAGAVLAEHGDAGEREELRTIQAQGRDALAGEHLDGLRLGVDRLRALVSTVQRRQPGWWVGLYQHLAGRQGEMTDPATAAFLVQQGRAALDAQDLPGLRQVCQRLWQFLPAPSRARLPAGLDPGVRA